MLQIYISQHMWVYKVTNNISNLIYWTVSVMDRH